ncbi:MAG: carbohydrate-binding domain-containing protein [Gaiellaceae bacterium]
MGPIGPQGPAGTPAVYPQLVDVNPILRPSASHLWDTIRTNSPSWFGTYRASDPDGDVTSYLEWKLPLEAGSWEIEVVYAADMNAGVMTFSLDGADVGSIDAYSASTEFNEVRVLTASVGASGIHTLKVRTGQTNAPNGRHYAYVTWIRLVRL